MTPDPLELEALAAKWLAGTATPDEAAKLHAWFDAEGMPAAGEEDGVLAVVVEEPVTAEDYRDRLWAAIQERMGEGGVGQRGKVRRLRWRVWRYAAAVVVLIGAALLYERVWSPRKLVAPPAMAVARDVAAPQSSRAVIRLPGGRQIDLDSARSGQLLVVDGVTVVKQRDGELAYNGAAGGPMVYHELFVPRGSRPVDITLADGTRVWLDAESLLRYPVAFEGHDRRVELSGQAYFEVANDAQHPFIVSVGGETVRVLGTRFNIEAYAEDNWVRTTLLSGRVSVRADSARAGDATAVSVLEPGEQALGEGGAAPVRVRSGVDTAVVMAWKNGRFEFNGADLPEIMTQLERWYDIDVRYAGPMPTVNFRGGVSRSANVSSLLNILQGTGSLHYSIRGRTVIIQK
jgi:transmembrane sensor